MKLSILDIFLFLSISSVTLIGFAAYSDWSYVAAAIVAFAAWHFVVKAEK